jgi:hypothetical protein
VVFEGMPSHIGVLLKIRILRSTGYTLYGEPVVDTGVQKLQEFRSYRMGSDPGSVQQS